MRWRTPAQYLAQLRSIARARGGEVLSSRYINDWTKLRFRCAEGHEWAQTPSGVKQGKWCAVCGWARGAAARKAPAIARLHHIVARRGGAVVSPQYLNSQTKLRFRCGERHEWNAVPSSVLRGTWCPFCANKDRMKQHAIRKHRVLRRLRHIAKKRGGEILSPAFVDSRTPLLFRCAGGHTWMALAESIDGGVWCPTCKEESLLALLQSIAQGWGGACLSERCRGSRHRLHWRCAQGHRWISTAEQIKRGIWCPKCRHPGKGDIGRMRQIALERGGQCLSNKYVDSETRLRWRCREDHEWDASPGAIVQSSWCRVCERGQGLSRARLSIAIMREMAAEQGGACLSTTYNGIYDRLRWRCARGHKWVTVANNVRRGGWCPLCAHSVRGTIDGLRAMAIQRGGRCLTRTWNDHRQPLLFECGQGHRFHVRANVVKTGVWCPECRG